MPIERIFPVVIARHSTALLEQTLTSLREFTEVIVHAPAASDELTALCDWYRNTHIIVRADQLGGEARNHGAGAAAGEWILALSAGEFLSDSLLASLRQLDVDDPNCVFAVESRRLFMGQPLRWGIARPRWRTRLYNRHRYQFDDAAIDEHVVLAGDTRRRLLKGTLWHEAVESLDDLFVATVDRARLRRRASATRHTAPVTLLRSLWTFVSRYCIKLGCLDGHRGLIVALAESAETFVALIAAPDRSDDTASTGAMPREQPR
jgi:hypothetical protein